MLAQFWMMTHEGLECYFFGVRLSIHIPDFWGLSQNKGLKSFSFIFLKWWKHTHERKPFNCSNGTFQSFVNNSSDCTGRWFIEGWSQGSGENIALLFNWPHSFPSLRSKLLFSSPLLLALVPALGCSCDGTCLDFSAIKTQPSGPIPHPSSHPPQGNMSLWNFWEPVFPIFLKYIDITCRSSMGSSLSISQEWIEACMAWSSEQKQWNLPCLALEALEFQNPKAQLLKIQRVLFM